VAEHLRNNADTKRNAVATNNTYSEPLPHTMNYHPMAVEKKVKRLAVLIQRPLK
jgi:hypothetical protein